MRKFDVTQARDNVASNACRRKVSRGWNGERHAIVSGRTPGRKLGDCYSAKWAGMNSQIVQHLRAEMQVATRAVLVQLSVAAHQVAEPMVVSLQRVVMQRAEIWSDKRNTGLGSKGV